MSVIIHAVFGDTGRTFPVQLTENGTGVDLTGETITAHFQADDGSGTVIASTGLSGDDSGNVSVPQPAGLTVGQWRLECQRVNGLTHPADAADRPLVRVRADVTASS